MQFQTLVFYRAIFTQSTFIWFLSNMLIYMSSHIAINKCYKGTFKTHELRIVEGVLSRHGAAGFAMFDELVCVGCILQFAILTGLID